MKLSVLVPAYNLEKYIKECLVSLCEQVTDFDFEVVVCDDASPDNTAGVIRSLALKYPVIRPIFKKQNGGLAANMKTLLASAKGDYIAYVDGDDVALPGKLQKQVDYLDAHSDCAMIYHESDMFDSDTGETIKKYSQGHYNWSQIPKHSNITHLIRYGTYMQASAVMFRRHKNLVDTVLDECKIILDYPFYIMNAGFLDARIDFIPAVLSRYRIHEDSFGGQTQKSVRRRTQSLNDIITACKTASRFEIDKQVIDAGIAHHQFAAALYFLFRANDEQFKNLIETSAKEKLFFNHRHKLVWQHSGNPEKLRKMLASHS